jgi:hypothetical protein
VRYMKEEINDCQEGSRHRVNRALLEKHIEQAMDNAARNPHSWRSMLDFVVDGCGDALDATLLEAE